MNATVGNPAAGMICENGGQALTVARWMSRNVITINQADPVSLAFELLLTNDIRHLPVLSRKKLVGIITESDIVYKVSAYGKDPNTLCVHEVMTKPCIVVNPDLGVEYVARLFANSRVHQAPVIRDRLEGIISVVDIMGQTG